jgi:NADPH:quinone reductase-like Zn-dependent oxidoreductase
MRAVMTTSATGPRVELGEVGELEPKPHEAVVEVAAFSPNRGETFLLEQPRPGWRPGKEVAGTVVRRAADGTAPCPVNAWSDTPGSRGLGQRVAVPTDRRCYRHDRAHRRRRASPRRSDRSAPAAGSRLDRGP